MEHIKVITSVDEITINDIYYTFTTLNRQDKFFKINYDETFGYSIYGNIAGDNPTYVGVNWNVKYWKTFNGVITAIKKFTKEGYWGFNQWF
jgi:hypothetical protein